MRKALRRLVLTTALLTAAVSAPQPALAHDVPPQLDERVVDAINTVLPAWEGQKWAINWEKSIYDPNRPLSFIFLDAWHGTGSSPQQLLLFDHGNYLGTGTIHNVGFQRVDEATQDSLVVNYGTPGASFSDVQYNHPVRYHLVDGRIEMTGVIPGHENG
ncbi:LppP/LprE family lipoprotein [Staphylococcus chromogenes]|nr:LppP/LprE family lipoprotein [Staphylococcus chromogenes]